MNGVRIHEDERFGNVRTLEEDGKVLFCGSDVAKALGYSNPNKAINDHCRAITKRSTPISGKTQDINFIPEGDVYRLIAHSKLPQAQEFETWIFDDVLPSIRKHGAYMTPETIESVLLNPDTIINLALQLKAERAKVAEMTPKAEYYDVVAKSEGMMNFRETAKMLQISEKKFIAAIERHGLCYRNSEMKLVPYARRIDSGWFVVKEIPYFTVNGPRTTLQTMITPKGREKIFELIKGEV